MENQIEGRSLEKIEKVEEELRTVRYENIELLEKNISLEKENEILRERVEMLDILLH
ncbi:MAG: hypothetical protein ABRQ25_07755 [Clostridiaceae bacterium]